MVDSVHLANWLARFSDMDFTFTIYPSRKYREMHPKLIKLFGNTSKANYHLETSIKPKALSNYIDYFMDSVMMSHPRNFSRIGRLAKIIRNSNFDAIHGLELQGAGYLLLENKDALKEFPGKIIVTNYGSDIYYFEKDRVHKKKIVELLELATHYSAECQRDYDLARELGFKGKDLPIVPNSTSFTEDELENHGSLPSQRFRIVVKTYGGTFGLGAIAIQAVEEILSEFPLVKITFYSVTDDLVDQVEKLKDEHPTRIEYFTVRKSLQHEALMLKFSESRVYLGCSRSDGISTSFLEALASGCYPIQTNTSCADEWVNIGAIASVIPPRKEDVAGALRLALRDDSLVDNAKHANSRVAKKYLSPGHIKKQLEHFYD